MLSAQEVVFAKERGVPIIDIRPPADFERVGALRPHRVLYKQASQQGHSVLASSVGGGQLLRSCQRCCCWETGSNPWGGRPSWTSAPPWMSMTLDFERVGGDCVLVRWMSECKQGL